MRKALEKLESPTFLSKDNIEDKFLTSAMIRTIGFHRPSIGLCFVCITIWSIFLFSPGSKMTSIVPASFPFDFQSGFPCVFVWAYQVLGTCYSALLYSTFDSLATGVYFHLTAQVNRLGYAFSKVEYLFFLEFQNVQK